MEERVRTLVASHVVLLRLVEQELLVLKWLKVVW